MSLYELLGVNPDATEEDIRKAFRKLSKTAHPDVGGGAEEYKEITEAYEVLMDPDKRRRYDTTGRTDVGVTREKVRNFITGMMRSVVDAEDKDGNSDDPVWENILSKILRSMNTTEREATGMLHKAKKKLRRTNKLLTRFIPLQDEDPVGDALREHQRSLNEEIQRIKDGLELSNQARLMLAGYHYVVGPDPSEGQDESDPTLHLTSGGVLRVRGRLGNNL